MIVKMRHLDLVCVASEKEATLDRLRGLGAVHLDLRSASGAAVAAAKGEAADAERAVRLILKAREGVSKNEGLEVRPHPVEEVLALDADREQLKGEVEELKRLIAQYEPYGDFDPALAKKIMEAGVDLSSVAELPEKLPEMRLSEMRARLAKRETRIAAATARSSSTSRRRPSASSRRWRPSSSTASTRSTGSSATASSGTRTTFRCPGARRSSGTTPACRASFRAATA